MKNIFKIEIFVLLIFLIFSIYSYAHIYTNLFSDNYAFNELFINYQAGLVRRGLLGEIFWRIHSYYNVDARLFFGYLFYILYIIQIIFLYLVLKKNLNNKLFYIFILFSPALILFSIYDPKVFFVKDIFSKITILIHAYLILFYDRKSYHKYLKYILIPVLTVSILIHEYQVLFLGIHLLFTITKLNNYLNLRSICKIYSFLILPTVFTLIFIGNSEVYSELSSLLSKFDVTLHDQLEGGFYKKFGGFYKWHFFYFSYNDFINFFLSSILSLLVPIIIYGNFLDKKIINVKNLYRWNYLLFFLPTLICFILALDHGRNISLVGTHLVIYYSILNYDKSKLKLLQTNIYKNINKLSLLILFLFFYLFLWKLDQGAGFAYQGKEATIFKSSLFAEFVKLIKLTYYYIDLYLIELPEIKL